MHNSINIYVFLIILSPKEALWKTASLILKRKLSSKEKKLSLTQEEKNILMKNAEEGRL